MGFDWGVVGCLVVGTGWNDYIDMRIEILNIDIYMSLSDSSVLAGVWIFRVLTPSRLGDRCGSMYLKPIDALDKGTDDSHIRSIEENNSHTREARYWRCREKDLEMP
jgi:hypothetical protein